MRFKVLIYVLKNIINNLNFIKKILVLLISIIKILVKELKKVFIIKIMEE